MCPTEIPMSRQYSTFLHVSCGTAFLVCVSSLQTPLSKTNLDVPITAPKPLHLLTANFKYFLFLSIFFFLSASSATKVQVRSAALSPQRLPIRNNLSQVRSTWPVIGRWKKCSYVVWTICVVEYCARI